MTTDAYKKWLEAFKHLSAYMTTWEFNVWAETRAEPKPVLYQQLAAIEKKYKDEFVQKIPGGGGRGWRVHRGFLLVFDGVNWKSLGKV